jgi:hypothetical protein
LIVAIGALGEQLGALPVEAGGTLVVLAVLSGLVFPVLFRLLAGRADPVAPPAKST